jgi:hypothetical protein
VTTDPDGFDEARRREVILRLVAMQAKHRRDERIKTMTPLDIAEADLEATIEFGRLYEAGETSFPVTESNTRAVASLIDERRVQVEELRGS